MFKSHATSQQAQLHTHGTHRKHEPYSILDDIRSRDVTISGGSRNSQTRYVCPSKFIDRCLTCVLPILLLYRI